MAYYDVAFDSGTLRLWINLGGYGHSIFRIVANNNNYPTTYDIQVRGVDDVELDKVFWLESGVSTRIYRHKSPPNTSVFDPTHASLAASILTIHGKQIAGGIGDETNQFRFDPGALFNNAIGFQSNFLDYLRVVVNGTFYKLTFDGGSVTASVDGAAAAGDPFIVPFHT